MENSGNEMAYFIIGLTLIVFIAGFYVDKIDFKKTNKKNHH
ncbi:MAG: hypothetical protein Q9M43_06240 [Sulfurimonas sp.]|nr:hypothetical protein [Sulfurimonas sp.]